MKYLSTILLIITCSSSAIAQVYPGMPAPELKVGSWVKGEPVKQFEKGQIYLVEFWATWCNPCRAMIPELTKLAEKYKGKVTVIGISVGESNTDLLKPFVAQMGDQMNYHVAIDAQESPKARKGFMIENWLWSAGLNTLPSAFIIGKTGQVDYLGGSGALEGVIEKILAGTWDTKAYAASIPELRGRAELFALGKPLGADLQSGNKTGYYQQLEAGFIQCAGQKSWEAINEFLWNHLAEAGNRQELPAGMRDYTFAIQWMNRVISQNPKAARYLDTLAWLYFRSGSKQRAIDAEQIAMTLAPSDETTRATFEKSLQTFKQ